MPRKQLPQTALPVSVTLWLASIKAGRVVGPAGWVVAGWVAAARSGGGLRPIPYSIQAEPTPTADATKATPANNAANPAICLGVMSRTGSHRCLWAGVQKPQQGPLSQGQKLAVTAGVALATAASDERTVLVKPKAPASDATAASAKLSSIVRKMLRPPFDVSQPHVSHITKSSLQGVLLRNRTIVSSRGKSPRAKRVVLRLAPRGRRLRQSNPFAGVLTPQERQTIFELSESIPA